MYRITLIAICVLSLQILLGGLTSANFAATACQTLPDCHGSYWPGSALLTAADLSLAVEIYNPVKDYEAVRDKWFGLSGPSE